MKRIPSLFPWFPGRRPLSTSGPSIDVQSIIEKAKNSKPTDVAVEDMIEIGRDLRPIARVKTALFIHRELPIRFLDRIGQLESLPEGLALMPSIQIIKTWYSRSLEEIAGCPPPVCDESTAAFHRLLDKVFDRHAGIMIRLVKGLHELKEEAEKCNIDITASSAIQEHLDRFYMARICVRALISHQLVLQRQTKEFEGGELKPPGQDPATRRHIGIFDLETNPRDLVETAVAMSRDLCERHLGEAPEVTILDCSKDRGGCTFISIPDNIIFSLTELLKNAMRAVVERHGDRPPPTGAVEVSYSSSPLDPDVSFTVSDRGAGIDRAHLPLVYHYLYSTAEDHKGIIAALDQVSVDSEWGRSIMAGFGHGLGLSRCYARAFGGDLSVSSARGIGTRADLTFPRIILAVDKKK